jgi:hypothetical protein
MPEKTEYQKFEEMTRRLMSVPHSEIKAKLEEEKRSKAEKKKNKAKDA